MGFKHNLQDTLLASSPKRLSIHTYLEMKTKKETNGAIYMCIIKGNKKIYIVDIDMDDYIR